MLQKLWTLRNRNRNKKGFTLIEMIVVIAIIAVLIALVAPLMTKYLGTAKTTRASAAAKSIYTAAQAYCADMTMKNTPVTVTKITSADTAAYDEIMSYLDNNNNISDVVITLDGKGNVTSVSCKVEGVEGKYPK